MHGGQASVLEVEAPAAGEAALGEEHAVGFLRQFDLCRHRERAVVQSRRIALGQCRQRAAVDELLAPCSQARAAHQFGVEAFNAVPVQRQDVGLLRLRPPQLLHLPDLLRMLRGEVVGLAEVFVDVVQLPGGLIHVELFAVRIPRRGTNRGGEPAVLVDATVAEQLEHLATAAILGLRVVEAVQHADAIHGLLRHAVEYARRLDAGGFEDGRRDVGDIGELAAQAPLVLDLRRPGDDQRVARATEVRGDLLGPLERRVHRMGPG
ncbi:hypothetical protein D3C76_611320 [compost metagenome]